MSTLIDILAGGVTKTEAVEEPKVEIKKQALQEGQLMRHKNRGTTVAIVKKNIMISASGAPMHLVVESRTGKQFKAIESNLEIAQS